MHAAIALETVAQQLLDSNVVATLLKLDPVRGAQLFLMTGLEIAQDKPEWAATVIASYRAETGDDESLFTTSDLPVID